MLLVPASDCCLLLGIWAFLCEVHYWILLNSSCTPCCFTNLSLYKVGQIPASSGFEVEWMVPVEELLSNKNTTPADLRDCTAATSQLKAGVRSKWVLKFEFPRGCFAPAFPFNTFNRRLPACLRHTPMLPPDPETVAPTAA